MVKEVSQYLCEICLEAYATKEQALDCEARGRPEMPVRGLVFGDPHGFYKNIIFAVAGWSDYGHRIEVSCWGARDNGAGDNLPQPPGSKNRDERCGFSLYAGSATQHRLGGPPDKNLPAYGRMVEALRAAGIEPVDQTPELRNNGNRCDCKNLP